MKLARTTSLILLLTCVVATADEQIRRVQEELRKRQLYFADIDGRLTKETQGALKRYQKRKGFTASGEVNPETLRSLDLVAPPPEETFPDVPVLKSDAARELAEADRKLLEEMEDGPLSPVAEAPLETVEVTDQPAGPEPVSPWAERAETFVRSYLDACKTNELPAELAFYADRVNYFDHGEVTRDFVARDVARYYKRWPQRDYELLDLTLGKTSEQEVEVKFRIRFNVKSPSNSASGRTSNIFKIRQTGDDLRFVSLKEQRVRK